jgi:hypothetical protein
LLAHRILAAMQQPPVKFRDALLVWIKVVLLSCRAKDYLRKSFSFRPLK